MVNNKKSGINILKSKRTHLVSSQSNAKLDTLTHAERVDKLSKKEEIRKLKASNR